MKDTVRLPRITKPAAAPTPAAKKPSGKDTVRIERPAANTPPASGTTLEDYLQQQKPHVDPPHQS